MGGGAVKTPGCCGRVRMGVTEVGLVACSRARGKALYIYIYIYIYVYIYVYIYIYYDGTLDMISIYDSEIDRDK